MQVADIRAPLYAVLPPVRAGVRHQSSGRSPDTRHETAYQPDERESRGTRPVVYGELLPRAAMPADNTAPGMLPAAPEESVGGITHVVLSHVGSQRAVDVYQTLQAHATAQVLRPVFRIDLYA